jgi:menaquinone-dependent protoporphyrinogen oxidase
MAMGDPRVLVAFANQAGSTAGIAGEIAAVLRGAGLAADCLVASEVDDLAPYRAIVLGSGVFVRGRHSDGGGFLARHGSSLADRPLWLFSAGPIGREHGDPATTGDANGESRIVAVARAVGARGAAVFGPLGVPADADPVEALGPVNSQRVRAWAAQIAADLLREPAPRAGRRCATRRDGQLVVAS